MQPKSKKENIKKIYLGNDFLEDEITDKVMSDLLASNKDYKALVVYINSVGGSVDNGIGLLDAISLLSIPVIGIAIGNCMSMAVNVFLACPHRLCTPSTYFMIHQSAYDEGLAGQIETIKETIRIQEERDAMLNGYIFKNTLITKEELKDYFQHKTDMYFSAKQALDYGIVSKIIKNEKEIEKFVSELT